MGTRFSLIAAPGGGTVYPGVKTGLNLNGYTRLQTWVRPYLSDILTPAPQRDQPAVTWTSTNATALTSPVVYAPPVVNGGAKVTGWDGQSDTNIRWMSGVFETNNGANSDLCVNGSIKPGGDAQFARWPIVVDFDTATSVSVVEVSGYSLSTASGVNVEVNGRMIARHAITRPSGAGGWSMTLTFPIANARRIRIWLSGDMGLVAVRVPTGQSITKPGAVQRRIGFISDSYGGGTGTRSGGPADGFAAMLARFMGADDIVNLSIGGRGFVAGNGGTAGAANPYSTSVATMLAKNPAVLITNGSINDGSAGAGVQAAVTSFLASVSSIPQTYVLGTLLSGYTANGAAVATATYAANQKFLDLRGFLTGSGHIRNLKGDGNRDFLLDTDNAHPIDQGHRAIAEAAFSLMYPGA